MEQFKLTIRLGNEAMQDSDDIAEALRRSADRIEQRDNAAEGAILDRNGNTVGSFEVLERPEGPRP